MFNKLYNNMMNTTRLMTFSFLFTFFISIQGFAQKTIWSETKLSNIPSRSDWSGSFELEKVKFYSLDLNNFKQSLANVPNEQQVQKTISSRNLPNIQIPMPDGNMYSFAIFQSSVMEEELQLKYPSIRSYKGFNIENPKEIIRFDVGHYGFHALIQTDKGLVQIDPYFKEDPTHFVVYHTEDYQSETYKNMDLCGSEHEMESKAPKHVFGMQRFDHEPMLLRQYRLALACTPTWASSRGTVENCLSDMNTMVNRANLIYEKELAIRMVLIAKNDQIIFLDANANPYTNTDQGRLLIGQNTQVLNQRIGTPAYDLGHVLSRCFDVGGIASLGSICSQGKGAGVTCHNNTNLESIVTRVMSHEMGHQMSASHTFSSCGQTDQLALGTAFEPGSGTTIMSYAGGCGSDNVASNNDDYYHVGSLDQILSYTNWTHTDAYICANKIDVFNTIPSASIAQMGGFTIPISTPFELTGIAEDLENDPMTYVWEQYDAGGPSPYGSPVGIVPIFRSLRPNSKTTRFFPNESRILANRLGERDEILPTYDRPMTFRFVVRDNNVSGGAANWDQIKFFASAEAGPFTLKYPLLNENFEVGQKVKVEWNVANTDKFPVNCKKVHVFLSVNDELVTGQPNLIPLALNVENDGDEWVIIPNYVTNKARIVIKAVGNIFLTTGIFPSVIKEPTKPAFFMQVNDNEKAACLPNSLEFEFETAALGGLTEEIQFEIASGLPPNSEATFSKTSVTGGEKTKLTLNLENVVGSNYYEVVVRSFVQGIDTLERTLFITLTGTDLDYPAPLLPDNGLTGAAQIQKYRWNSKIDATTYQFQLASNPSFSTNDLVIDMQVLDTFVNSNLILNKSSIYFWRTRAINHCRNGEWSEVFAFNTVASSCFTTNSGQLSLNISGSGMPTVEGSLFVNQENVITDINVKKMVADHARVGDLSATLISPSNTELLLWSKKCGTSKGFYVGFDDESVEFFKCPINTGKIYKPDVALDIFNGESSLGVWKLRIDDLVSGEGGRFHEFELEICTNVTLDPPLIVKNLGTELPRLTTKIINNDVLLTSDNNTTPDKLIYTIVKKPGYGYLSKNSIVLNEGDKFSQVDLNSGTITYKHEWGLEKEDYFAFTVEDGEGGWVPISKFDLLIDQTTSVLDEKQQPTLMLYPNPTDGLVSVYLESPLLNAADLTIYDIHGKPVFQANIQHRIELDMKDYRSGIYIIQLKTGSAILQKKLIKN
ncbi:MAG: reprolysin-like metallopeptidase [Saprospiraceae bacterium]